MIVMIIVIIIIRYDNVREEEDVGDDYGDYDESSKTVVMLVIHLHHI